MTQLGLLFSYQLRIHMSYSYSCFSSLAVSCGWSTHCSQIWTETSFKGFHISQLLNIKRHLVNPVGKLRLWQNHQNAHIVRKTNPKPLRLKETFRSRYQLLLKQWGFILPRLLTLSSCFLVFDLSYLNVIVPLPLMQKQHWDFLLS